MFTNDEILEDSYVRELDTAQKILELLTDVQLKLIELFKSVPSLEGLFDKEFGAFQEFCDRESILETCLLGNFLLPDKEMLSIENIEETKDHKNFFENWIDNTQKRHEETQKLLDEEFHIKINFKSLNCQCVTCIGDYRNKLREFVYNFSTEKIAEATEKIKNDLEEKSVSDISEIVFRLQKEIEKQIHTVRFRLRRSTLSKLESSLKALFKETFSYPSELTKVYSEKVYELVQLKLAYQGLTNKFLTKEELDRFYMQLGTKLWRSERFLGREIEKLIQSVLSFKRKDISANILTDYLGQFWMHANARKIKRKIVYHRGPTNSGKTYQAIQSLVKAKAGCYLAPLRLLASELYDTLNSYDVKTTLLTGEEVIPVEGATHYSSTIEMAKLHEPVEVCVIDEIQMINDSQRGWAWTRALINMEANEIHLCGDDSALELVEKIVELTGDELDIKSYERLTKLEVLKKTIPLTSLEKGDALIVFSRRNALKYKADLEDLGFKVSIIYGMLGPEVRREQARKFDEGETDVIVSTDAIAMGMNLPIKRIVFSTLSKFINSREFPISESEIKQISGRAGRYKRFPTGYVSCLTRVEDGIERVKNAIGYQLQQKQQAMVGPDLEIFSQVNEALQSNKLPILSLSEFLRLFNTMTFSSPFYCVDLKEMIELAETVESADEGEKSLSSSEIFGFACAPVNLGLIEHLQYYIWIVNNYVKGFPIYNEEVDVRSDNIDYLETSIKCVELYQWLARHFNKKHFDFAEQELLHNKSLAIERLNQLLSERLVRSCSSCGVKLPTNSQFHICEECYSKRRFRRRRPSKKTPLRGKNLKSSFSGNKKKRSSSGTKRRSKRFS